MEPFLRALVRPFSSLAFPPHLAAASELGAGRKTSSQSRARQNNALQSAATGAADLDHYCIHYSGVSASTRGRALAGRPGPGGGLL